MVNDSAVRICPRTGHSMTHHVIDDLHLDICDSCGGVWYDAGQFTRLIRDGEKEVAEALADEPPKLTPVQSGRREMCPVEGLPLHQSLYKGHPGIEISTCFECGGIFITAEALRALDKFETEHGGVMPEDPQVPAEAGVLMGQMEAQRASDIFRSQLATNFWNVLSWRNYYSINNIPLL